MGTSHPETKPWILQKIRQYKPKTILDVGAGSGTYSSLLKRGGYTRASIDAVEVWEPYIDEFNLKSKYRNVYQTDIRDFDRFNHDLVIFGDVLEHMSVQDALKVWDTASKYCAHAVISIPIIHYHQHAINGNPYEEHVKEDWSHEEVLQVFTNITDSWQGRITGAYWADFR
jgi:2-polyprenyl-3-methyl-5-hydroxy-6-metoxy-1,4-benzoquinol methylase